MKGRKPKSTRLQIAEGDPRDRGVHKLEQKLASEPKPTVGLPPCPRHLRGRARVAWKFFVEELKGMKLDARPDATMLEGVCVHYEKAVDAYIKGRKDGDVIEDPITITSKETGEPEIIGYRLKKNPWVAIRERSWLIVKAFCSEFGFSPVSRTRLTIDRPDDGEADLAAILSRPRPTQSQAVN